MSRRKHRSTVQKTPLRALDFAKMSFSRGSNRCSMTHESPPGSTLLASLATGPLGAAGPEAAASLASYDPPMGPAISYAPYTPCPLHSDYRTLGLTNPRIVDTDSQPLVPSSSQTRCELCGYRCKGTWVVRLTGNFFCCLKPSPNIHVTSAQLYIANSYKKA